MRSRAKAEAALSEAGRKTEDALKEMGVSVKDVFRGVEGSLADGGKWAAWPNWWQAAERREEPRPSKPQTEHRNLCPVATGVPGVLRSQVADTQNQLPSKHLRIEKSNPEARQAHNDLAMRRYCAALERLVDLGLSPEAAQSALQHLDDWVVGDEGKAQMAAAEAAIHAAGGPILHVGDAVRLEGLVQVKAANGKQGKLQTYRAEDGRWKVYLADGQVYWVRPHFMKPLVLRRLPLPEADAAESACREAMQKPGMQTTSLATGWAKLEARRAAWKEEQEAREIDLLEREEALRKAQDMFEFQRQLLEAQRHSFALEQARSLAQLEAKGPSRGSHLGTAASFALAGDSPRGLEAAAAEEAAGGEAAAERPEEGGEDSEADEMWDMDWTKLAPAKAAVVAASGGALPAPSGEEGGSALPEEQPDSSSTSGAGASGAATAVSAAASAAAAGTAAAATATTPACVMRGSERWPAAGSALQVGAESSRVPLSLDHAERDMMLLRQKLDEKRLLAELHNGKDLAATPRSEYCKPRMPGVHPAIAEKLEVRRRQLEESFQQELLEIQQTAVLTDAFGRRVDPALD